MKNEINVSASDGRDRIRHIGVYADIETSKRIEKNIEYFAGGGYTNVLNTSVKQKTFYSKGIF